MKTTAQPSHVLVDRSGSLAPPQPSAVSAATECRLLGFLLDSSLLLLLFSLLPTGIGVVFLHTFGENIGLPAEILLIHHAVLGDDERHHTGRPVFRRIG